VRRSNLEDRSIDEGIEQFDVTREQVLAVLDSWLRAFARTTSSAKCRIHPSPIGYRLGGRSYSTTPWPYL
jgi:hypothetical protein